MATASRPGRSPHALMAARPPPPSQASASLAPGGRLVFAGGGEREAALAKAFWNSATLQPPLESRLGPLREDGSSAGSRKDSAGLPAVPSGLRRRSGLDLAQRDGPVSAHSSSSDKEAAQDALRPEKREEKERYLQKAKRREEIIALLKKQREERIMKEAISQLHKPKAKPQESSAAIPESYLEDLESVKALT